MKDSENFRVGHALPVFSAVLPCCHILHFVSFMYSGIMVGLELIYNSVFNYGGVYATVGVAYLLILSIWYEKALFVIRLHNINRQKALAESYVKLFAIMVLLVTLTILTGIISVTEGIFNP